MTLKRKEQKNGAPFKSIILALLLCVLIGIGGYFAGLRTGNGTHHEMSAVVLQNQITAMSELGTMTYAYTELGKYKTQNEFYGVKLPFTTSSFILTYDGGIKAGIDMSKAEVVVSGDKVKVSLPPAQILSHEIDEESVQLYDEKKSIFNPFTVKDYTKFYADQKKKVEEKALARGLLTEAEKQAEIMLKGLLTDVSADGYEIEVICADAA